MGAWARAPPTCQPGRLAPLRAIEARQPEVARRGERRESAVLDEGGDLVGHADIGLVDDPELALEAGAFNNAVVELVALLLGNDRSIQGNTSRR
jgi:hypothetical protein